LIFKTNRFLPLFTTIMAPSTPKKKTKRREYDTIRRTRFFNTFNAKEIH
jgi:hypothetical protein